MDRRTFIAGAAALAIAPTASTEAQAKNARTGFQKGSKVSGVFTVKDGGALIILEPNAKSATGAGRASEIAQWKKNAGALGLEVDSLSPDGAPPRPAIVLYVPKSDPKRAYALRLFQHGDGEIRFYDYAGANFLGGKGTIKLDGIESKIDLKCDGFESLTFERDPKAAKAVQDLLDCAKLDISPNFPKHAAVIRGYYDDGQYRYIHTEKTDGQQSWHKLDGNLVQIEASPVGHLKTGELYTRFGALSGPHDRAAGEILPVTPYYLLSGIPQGKQTQLHKLPADEIVAQGVLKNGLYDPKGNKLVVLGISAEIDPRLQLMTPCTMPYTAAPNRRHEFK